MTPSGGDRHFTACGGEGDGTVGFALNEAISFESSDGSVGRHMADREPTRDFDQSAFPFFGDQIIDGFDIILRSLRRVIFAHAFVLIPR